MTSAVSYCLRFDISESLHILSGHYLRSPKQFVEETNRMAGSMNLRSYHFSLCRAASEGHVLVAQEILKIAGDALLHYADGAGWTPLHWAILRDKFPVVKSFIQYNVGLNTLNACGQSPLWLAIDSGKLPFVKVLFKNGAIAHPELNVKQMRLLQRAQEDIAHEIDAETETLKEILPVRLIKVSKIIAEYTVE